uniref:Uncharacterized protein n=1 Tax=Peronospora matthiolae TaxID=2874970 RepID=A0AAV1TUK4_9STRA
MPRRQDRSSPRASALRPRAVAGQSDAAEKTLRSPNQLNVLLSNQTPPTTFVATCRALRAIDETALLATIDVRTWNVALQRRPEAQDERVAAELLGLIASCSRETASVPIPRARRRGHGCANIKMFADAHELLLYQQTLWSEICSGTTTSTTTDETLTTGWSEQSKALMPPSVFASAAFDPVQDFQQEGFLELFKASVYTQQSPRNVVHVFSDYVERTRRAAGGKVERVRTRVLERGFGDAIHCCVNLDEYSLALHCYEVMESTRERLVCAKDNLPVDDAIDEGAERVGIVDEVLPADENVYVNVLKACTEIEDFSTFIDEFR